MRISNLFRYFLPYLVYFETKLCMMVLPKLFRYFLHYLVYFEIKSCTMVFQVCSFLHSHSFNYFKAKVYKQCHYNILQPYCILLCFVECEFWTNQIKVNFTKCCQNNLLSHTIYCIKFKGNSPNCNKKRWMNNANTPNQEMTQYIKWIPPKLVHTKLVCNE